jgi:hypothetical protein
MHQRLNLARVHHLFADGLAEVCIVLYLFGFAQLHPPHTFMHGHPNSAMCVRICRCLTRCLFIVCPVCVPWVSKLVNCAFGEFPCSVVSIYGSHHVYVLLCPTTILACVRRYVCMALYVCVWSLCGRVTCFVVTIIIDSRCSNPLVMGTIDTFLFLGSFSGMPALGNFHPVCTLHHVDVSYIMWMCLASCTGIANL